MTNGRYTPPTGPASRSSLIPAFWTAFDAFTSSLWKSRRGSGRAGNYWLSMDRLSILRNDPVLAAVLFVLQLDAQGPGPSLVTVNGRRLIVQKRNSDGSLASPAP